MNTKPALVALAWVFVEPLITSPIIGASKLHHLADAVAQHRAQARRAHHRQAEKPYSNKPWRGTAQRIARRLLMRFP